MLASWLCAKPQHRSLADLSPLGRSIRLRTIDCQRVRVHICIVDYGVLHVVRRSALISDLWDTKTRGTAMTSYSLAPFAGPALGPTVGGWIDQSGTNWRWIFWVTTCFAGTCLVLIVFTLPETYV